MGLEKDLNIPPYFADHNPNDRYHLYLARPSTALQAREFTGIQQMLQNQIERFGNHIFKDGAIVDGVPITYYPKVHYISLADTFATNTDLSLSEFDSSYLITNGTNSNNAVRAVIKIAKTGIAASAPNTNRVYLDYIKTGRDGSNNDVSYFVPGDTLYFYSSLQNKLGNLDANNLVDSISTLASNGSFTSNGFAYAIGVGDGIIFQKGVFQKVEPQVITVKDFDTNVSSYVVGFDTTETIVDEYIDPNIVDNALGYPNENAPGAHRLKLTPTLVAKTRTDTANNKNFFAIVEFDNNAPTEQKDDAQYDALGKTMAKRTYEESGDYVVKPFQVESRVNAANNQSMFYEVSSGIAYVRGMRVEKLATTKVEVPRGITTAVAQNQLVTGNYGAYVVCQEFDGAFPVETLGEVSLYDTAQRAISDIEGHDAGVSGASVGVANVRAVIFESGVKGTASARYLVYLFNIRMNSGKSFASDVKSIYVSSGAFGNAKADVVLENGLAVLKEQAKSTLLFNTGIQATKRLTDNTGVGDTSFVYNQVKSGTLNANGVVTITIDSSAAGGVERLNATTGATLTGSQIENYNFYVTSNAYSNNVGGVITVTSGSAVVTGSGFSTNMIANTLIRVQANSSSGVYIRRVVAVANDTSVTLDGTIPAATNSNAVWQRFWLGGSPLPMANVTINSNTSLTSQLGFTLDASKTVWCSYPVNRTQAVAIPKVIQKSRFVKINCSNNVAGITGPWDLGFTDVHKIRSVYVGTTFATSNPNRVDWFTLDNGGRSDFYDHGRLIIKPEYASQINTNARFLVELDHFLANTSVSVGFFAADSYPIDDANTANTNAIQTLALPFYEDYELRNYVDFRPRKFGSANNSATTDVGATENPPVSNTSFDVPGTGQYLIMPDQTFTCDIEYYLPRVDLLTLDPYGNFNVIQGTPSVTPRAPFVENDQSAIAEIAVPAYPTATKREFDTYKKLQSTRINLKTNRRYTMRDIGVLEERIKRVEYYTVLNILEQQAKDVTIPDADGLDRFKNGIFADPFNSHNIGNVQDFEYKIAIDPKETVARPYIKRHDIDFIFNSSNSANVQRTGSNITLPYTAEKYISQRYATKFRNAAESLWQWNGRVTLYPAYDFFRDETQAPNVNVNLDLSAPWEQFANSPWGAQYGDWRDVGTTSSTQTNTQNLSQFVQQTTTTTTTQTTQQQIVEQLKVDTMTSTMSLGAYVKDVSIQPYMRSRLVAFVSYNMKPNTRIYPFFDDVNVSAHCAPGVLSGVTAPEAGKEDQVVSQRGNFGDAIVSDNTGFVCGIFRIPANTFRTGDRLFQLTNVSDLITGADARITVAKATYTADNVSVTKGSSTITVKEPLLRTSTEINQRTNTTITTDVRTIDNTPPPPVFTGGGGDGGGDGGNGSCFTAGTLVTMADGTKKPIEQVKIGDILRGLDTDNLVVGYDSPMLADGREPILYGINGGRAFVTSEHPFLTTKGWKAIDPSETKRLKPHLSYLNVTKLVPGDVLVTEKGSEEVTSIEAYPDQPEQQVFNFVLNGDNTYIADGYIVHNRDPITQSFRIDYIPADVSGVFVTGIGVYFYTKDANLGCSIEICEMENGYPNESRILATSYLPSSSINTSATGATETVFNFSTPVYLLNNQEYAFIIQPDGNSPEYQVWVGETGGYDIVSDEQVFSNPYSGIMFVSANRRTWTAIQKEDIKFNVYRARFTNGVGSAVFNNEAEDNIVVGGISLINNAVSVQVGDIVYSVNSTPNTALTANGNPFGRVRYINTTTGEITLENARAGFSNTTNPHIRFYRVSDPANTSLITATNHIAFANITLVQNKKYHAIVPKFGILQPTKTNLSFEFKGYSNTNVADSAWQLVENHNEFEYADLERHIMSTSNEATGISAAKSATFRVNLTSTSDFVSPVIDLSKKSMLFIENLINNDVTNEHTRYGSALSKYVGKKVILADGQEAEDLRIYMTAFRPYDTDVAIYVKFKNSADPQPFDDKVWTKMEYLNGGELVYSSPTDARDFIEYELGVPSVNAVATGAFANIAVDTLTTLTGTVNIANNSANITGTGTSFDTQTSVGQRIRVVSGSYEAVRTVVNIANATHMTVDQGLQAANTAALSYVFATGGNDGIVEYRDSSGARYIGFKEFALKIVLLSANPVRVPRLNDVRGIALQR